MISLDLVGLLVVPDFFSIFFLFNISRLNIDFLKKEWQGVFDSLSHLLV